MPHLMGLHPLDALIVFGSMIAVLIIGASVSRGVKGETDFFVSGRNMGAWLQFFLNFGQATDSNGAPTMATEVYRQGVGGMWLNFQTLFITPFIWFTSIWFRRTRLITAADLMLARFNSVKLTTIFAVYTALLIPLSLGLGNVISYKVCSALMVKTPGVYTADEKLRVARYEEYQSLKAQLTADRLPPALQPRYDELDSMVKKGQIASSIPWVQPLPFYLVYTAIVAAYIMLGGIRAAAITDSVQGILIIIFSALMIPLGLHRIGGFTGLHAIVPPYKFLLFGSATMSEYAWHSIFAIVFVSLINFGMPLGPQSAAGRNEVAIRLGYLGGVFAKRFVMIAWMLCGLLALAIFSHGMADPDKVWGALAGALLRPGLMGLMISGMLLGHMPAVGVNAVNFSALFTRNLYEPFVRGRSQRHYMFVAKASILGVLLVGILFALFFSGAVAMLAAWITLQAFFGAASLLIYFWRKLTPESVGIGVIIWLVLMTIVPWMLPRIPAFRRSTALVAQTSAYTVQAKLPATEQDVAAGRATRVGQPLPRPQVIAPVAMYFESVALVNPLDPASPLEGVGRFNVENFILSRLGMSLKNFSPAALVTTRWMFDGIFPFVVLIGLSLLKPHRERPTGDAATEADPLASMPDHTVATAVAVRPRTWSAEQLRIARFYALQKTPVAPTPEEDAREVALSEADPTRFDHLKMFPNTAWEFTVWSKTDIYGFLGCWAGVFAILIFLWWLLRIGS